MYTIGELIDFFANKAGGAHYSPTLPKDFAELLTIGLGGQPVLMQALYQIGAVTYHLGVQLLRQIAEFEMHLVAFIPPQSILEPRYIFDSQYDGSPMRVWLRLDPGMHPVFGLVGIDGYRAELRSERLISWSEPHHLLLKHSITDDMSSHMLIGLDGHVHAEFHVPHLIFVDSDPLHYDTYVNRSAGGSEGGLDFCLAAKLVFAGPISLREQAEIVMHCAETLTAPERPCVYYPANGFARAAPGTKDLQHAGRVVMWSFEGLARGERPSAA
jgi:hypothetical protein